MTGGGLLGVGPEVVREGELASEAVLVGRDRFAVEQPGGIGVGTRQGWLDVAEVLVEGLVLLDDVQDVHLLAQFWVARQFADDVLGLRVASFGERRG